MFERILKRMREKIRTRQYVMTLHAEEEMNDEGLTIYDVERGILTGEILERQKNTVTAEWKYRIRGEGWFKNLLTLSGSRPTGLAVETASQAAFQAPPNTVGLLPMRGSVNLFSTLNEPSQRGDDLWR